MRKRKDKKEEMIVVKPNVAIIWAVKFAIVMVVALSFLETFHLVLLRTWNGEIFGGILSLTGFVTGVLASHKA
jgi:hypothetical protein